MNGFKKWWALFFLMLASSVCAWGGTISISGTQVRGQGTDGQVTADPVYLTNGGSIVSASCDGDGFWIEGPDGIRKFRPAESANGVFLGKGRYKAIPYLFPNQEKATIQVEVKPNGGEESSSGSSADFSGIWVEGGELDAPSKMTLKQNGTSVSGGYTHNNGTISGTVSGRTLHGTWSEGGRSGKVEFTLAEDGNSWSGKWIDGQKSGSWTGSRKGTGNEGSSNSQQGINFSGTWEEGGELDAPSKMTLKQSGSSVTGSYTHNNGTILGTVSGRTLHGTWGEGGRSGKVEFTLSEDGNTWTGKWIDGQKSGPWTGKRSQP